MNWAAFLLVIAAAVFIGAVTSVVTWVASVLVRNWGVYAAAGFAFAFFVLLLATSVGLGTHHL